MSQHLSCGEMSPVTRCHSAARCRMTRCHVWRDVSCLYVNRSFSVTKLVETMQRVKSWRSKWLDPHKSINVSEIRYFWTPQFIKVALLVWCLDLTDKDGRTRSDGKSQYRRLAVFIKMMFVWLLHFIKNVVRSPPCIPVMSGTPMYRLSIANLRCASSSFSLAIVGDACW